MLQKPLSLSPSALVGLQSLLRASCPALSVRPIDPSRTYAVQAQWARDVEALATWLDTTVPGFDRNTFVRGCTPAGRR